MTRAHTTDTAPGIRDRRVTTRIGLTLAVTFGICFVTGLLSHWIQHPPSWFAWVSVPIWLYRLTQGVHVVSGVVAIPLLLAKLAVVYPKLFEKPIIGSPVRGLERLSIAVLVSAGIFQLMTGLLNIAQWYPWKFFFTTTHYAMAYVVVGALALHVAVKLPIIRDALQPSSGKPVTHTGDLDRTGISRRGMLRLVWGAGAVAGLAFAGQAVTFLRPVAFLAPRSGTGPQGLPINRTAQAAGVTRTARDPDYRLTIVGRSTRTLTLDDLRALPHHTVDLPIACVEGWSVGATWRGIRIRDLAALVGDSGADGIRVISLERGLYAVSELPSAQSTDPLTLLALELNGSELDLDHGYPCRLIAPNLPGVMQTKWVSRIEVL
ncbi:molybdopterin-dependent oxidoreductase [Gordonia sp. NPDC003424]